MEFSNINKKSIFALLLLCLGIVIIALVVNILFDGKFITAANLNSICTSAAITSFAAWGYCFIFALNYMDLSVGATMVLVIYAAGELGNRIGIAGVVIGGITAGIILMMINFNIFAWLKIPSWIAGLGMCLIYEAIAAFYANTMQAKGGYVVLLNSKFSTLGQAPGIYIVLGIGLIGAYFLYNRSTFGINVRSIGSNPAVAKAMGINITKMIILTGLVCGILIGCAGFLRVSYSLRVYAQTGLTSLSMIFPPLASVFLAQVMSKRINMIVAIPFCALLIYMCFNVLSIMGVQSGTLQETLLGLFVLVFGVIAQRGTTGVVK